MYNKEFIRDFWIIDTSKYKDVEEMILKTECVTVKQAFFECSRYYKSDEHKCLDLLTTYKECRKLFNEMERKIRLSNELEKIKCESNKTSKN